MSRSICFAASTVSGYLGAREAATWTSPSLSRAQPVASSKSLVEWGVLQISPKKKSAKSGQSSSQ
jgi:hypothetical protein